VTRPMNWQNVPRLEEIVVHMFSNAALKDDFAIRVAAMTAMTITGVQPEFHVAKKTIAQWGFTKDKLCAVSATIKGPQMYRFLASCIEIVMPKVKEFRGVKGSTGDRSGNLAFGFDPEIVAQFPEIEVNYDMYPTKLIPGAHIIVKTSATNDKQARVLLGAMGVPFYGKLEDW